MSSQQLQFIKKTKKKKFFTLLGQMLVGICFLVIWELLSRFELINSFIFSSPVRCLKLFCELLRNGTLFEHFFTTLIEVIIAFSLGIGFGLLIAIILYLCPMLYKIVEPYLTMLNSLPKVALGPILIIWSGANTKTIILMALLINLIVSVLTILNGFKNTDSVRLKLLKSLGANKIDQLRYLILPEALTTIIASLKLNISMTLIGVVMGEFLVSKKGIGYLIVYGTQVFNLDLVILGIFVLVFMSSIMFAIISFLEKKLIK